MRWLPPASAFGKVLGVIFGPAAAAAKQWDSVTTAMITQLHYWGRMDFSYRGRTYLLSTYVRSLAAFLEAYVRPAELRIYRPP